MSVIIEYINKFNPQQKTELNRIRKICLHTIPDAEETISYGVPTLKYKGKMLISFNAYPNHIGLYPGAAAVESLKPKLTGFETSKGTIRYTLENPLSDALIKQTIEIRKKAIDLS